MKKTRIIGCGSLLMGDDAAGCQVARRLQEMDLPDHVEVIEGGTPGLKLLSIMQPGERVIIVDAVVTGAPAGTLHHFLEEDLPKPSVLPYSAHAIAIPEAIALGRHLEPELMPDTIEIWGIEVTTPLIKKMETSREVSRGIDEMTQRLVRELNIKD